MGKITPTPIKVSWWTYSNKAKPDALAADPDIVLTNPAQFPVDVQSDLVLQAMGGTELLYYARHDTVNGQKVTYQPIKDVELLAITYSPQTLTGSTPTWRGFRNSFSIQLDENKLYEDPEEAGSLYVEDNMSGATANIIVELQNLLDSDVVEISVSNAASSTAYVNPLPVLFGGASTAYFNGIVHGGNALGYNRDMAVDGGKA